jgi:hypothetical protein
MTRFLIEVPHSAETVACARAIHALLSTGSHYLTHADWGCRDNEHKAWAIVEVEGREDARRIVPPAFRSEAKIVELCKFSLEEVEEMLRMHGGVRAEGRLAAGSGI